MGGSLPLGRFAGIGVYVHWTFALLIAWLFFITFQGGGTVTDAVREIVFILAVFACVVLHEFGHALTAKRFGIRTRDITILPIGGVARLERMPEKPSQELLVAIAGPAVNVAIAFVLWVGLTVTRSWPTPPPPDATGEQMARYAADMPFFARLLWVNVALVLFNLLPAFPMDGGRVLRSLLAMHYDYATATRAAATVGQVMAGLFAIAGIFWNPWLLLIAVFVFMGAQAEANEAETRRAFRGVRVGDAMMTDFRTLNVNDTLADAVQALLAGSQTDFPVMSEGQVAGVLPRTDLLRALASKDRNAPIHEVMRRDCARVSESDPLDQVLARIRESGCPMVPVISNGHLTGLLTLDNLGELMMVHQAIRGKDPKPANPVAPTGP